MDKQECCVRIKRAANTYFTQQSWFGRKQLTSSSSSSLSEDFRGREREHEDRQERRTKYSVNRYLADLINCKNYCRQFIHGISSCCLS